jgi:RNA polymerase sigma-B factor
MTPMRQPRASTHRDRRMRKLVTLLDRSSAGDPRARESVIVELLPYARYLARRFAGRGEPLEDLYQAACVGLIKAVDRYDPERGGSFVAYAELRILGEIRHHFRATQRLHMPRSLRDRARLVAGAREDLRAKLGAEPTREMVAAHLGLEADQVREAEAAARADHLQPLDAAGHPLDADALTLSERVGQPDDEYDRVEAALWCRDALVRLRPHERDVVALRFGGNLTQGDIARRIGVSQMQVSRILRAALAAMTAVPGIQ